jgi:hypothetical protein
MMHENDTALLALARGELPPSEAREVEDHAAGCASCGRELAWLRTERGLFRARPAPVPSHVWQGIERRIIIAREERRDRRRAWLRGGSVAATFAAAAALLVFVCGHGLPVGRHPQTVGSEGPAPAPETTTQPASAVLDAAEREYSQAIQKLTDEYASARDQLDPETADRYDEEFSKLRSVLTTERAAARDDIRARRRVLRAYSAYMRSMQAVVLEVHQ